eukprot:GHVL01027865.1.p1 GENE.GHVL01027865.1~~GHVL01027865.1.p1  ORF type:complete len:119 (-),score=9.15 GHVL01027865.1:158-514(-)
MVDAPGARVTSLESSIKHLSPVLISKPNETRMGLYASSEGGVGNICEPAFDRCNFDESFVSLTFFVEVSLDISATSHNVCRFNGNCHTLSLVLETAEQQLHVSISDRSSLSNSIRLAT